jgi:hypothetical protein
MLSSSGVHVGDKLAVTHVSHSEDALDFVPLCRCGWYSLTT